MSIKTLQYRTLNCFLSSLFLVTDAMKTLCALAVVAVILICSDASPVKSDKQFISKMKVIRGRPWHGLVPKPDTDPKATKAVARYFDAKVDNFDSSNTKTYKQVSVSKIKQS